MTLLKDKTEILPYYKFDYEGVTYLFNIEKVKGGKISKDLSSFLDKISKNSSPPANKGLIKELEAFDLIIKKEEPLKEKEEEKEAFEADPEGKKDPALEKMKADGFIRNIALFVTQYCNLNCIYCYGHGGEYGKKGAMEEKTAFQAVDWLIEKSEKYMDLSISFFGGEPLLNYELIKKVVSYSKKKGKEKNKRFKYSITTNGTLLNDKIINYFKENKFSVVFSFDGPKEIQDKNRPCNDSKKSSYNMAVEHLPKLLTEIHGVVCRSTFCGDTEIKEVTKEINKYNFSKYTLVEASGTLFGKASPAKVQEEIITFSEEKIKELIIAIKEKDKEKLKDLKKCILAFDTFLTRRKKRFHPCGAGKFYVGVSTSGDIYPCHRFVGQDEFKLGSIYEQDLNGQEDYLGSPALIMDECKECVAKYHCAGGCVYMNAVATGSIFKPDKKACELQKALGRMKVYIMGNIEDKDIDWLEENEIIRKPPCYLDF